MDKLSDMLNPQKDPNSTMIVPKKRETNQFIRRHHVKNKLSLDTDPSYSHAFESMALTLQKEPANKIEPISNKYQTLDPEILRESLHSSELYGNTIDVSQFSYGNTCISSKKGSYPPPPKIRNKTPNPRNNRHKNFNSIDYDREHSITIEAHNVSIYSQKPPTPTRNNIKSRNGNMTTQHSKQSRVSSLEPIVRSRNNSRNEIKEAKRSETRITSEMPSTKESYTTLTSVYQSNDKLAWQESGYLDRDPNDIIKNIVEKHIEDSYKKIDMIKANFKKNNNKFLFQLYSGD
jgi:hypothetical protein